MTRSHPHPDELRRFGLGELSEAAFEAIADHLQSCEECCQQLRSLPDDALIVKARAARSLLDSNEPASVKNERDTLPEALKNHPRYEVIARIGKGGMGVVYKARHKLLSRMVALKVISASLLANQTAVERFRREVRSVGRLNHPNIVAAHDAEEAGGRHFLVMEYVEGRSLDAIVSERGPLSIANACAFIVQAAQGLQYAHEQGLVHRDVKPQNLMLTREGTIKVLDLGLARYIDSPPSAEDSLPGSLTSIDAVVGTPDYLAPEQARNAPRVDARADLYSLGCTLFYLLTGRPPFPGGTGMEKVMRHCHDTPPEVRSLRPEVSPHLTQVLAKMMAKSPTDRYQTAAEVAQALMSFRVQGPQAASQETDDSSTLIGRSIDLNARADRSTPSRRWWWSILFLLILAVGIALFAYFNTDRHEPLGSPTNVRTVLLVLPRNGLWYADYKKAHDALRAANVNVIIAASRAGPCELFDDPLNVGQPVHTDVVLDGSQRVADYDALICCGTASEEYAPGTVGGKHLQSLVEDMLTHRDRYVVAIGLGQRTLGRLGLLRGRLVAGCHVIDFKEQRDQHGVKDVLWQTVVVHGQVLTCLHADHADELARTLAGLLRKD